MKTLLVAFLLAIVSLQAAFAAVGNVATATAEREQSHARAAAGLATADPVDVDTDALKASAAIEELSDYVIAFLAIPRAIAIPPPSAPTVSALASVYLPRTEPPPRG